MKHGHLFYEWERSVLYTDTELRRIHRHFYHPQPERIFNLMKRSNDPEATPETYKQLMEITQNCEVYQRLAEQPNRFRVSLPPDEIVFNRTVLMDLMSLSSKTVLYIICKDTLFSAAVFVRGESSVYIWNEYVRIWVNPYVGHPKVIHADFGPQFRSVEWKTYLQMNNIKRHTSSVESHNASGVGERYHEYLR